MAGAALKNELAGLAEASAEGATSSIGWRDARQTVDLLRIQRDSLSKDLKAEHPRIIKINEDIERLEKLIAVYEEESKDKLNRSRVALKTRISSVEQAAQKWESLVLDANGRMSEFERLRGDVQRAQTLYDRLAHLLQNVDVTKSVSQENVAILDPAFVKPAALRAAVKLPLVMIIGGIVGVGLVGFMAHRDDRCTGIMELRRYGMPVVGRIPKAPMEVGKQNAEWIGPQDKRLEWTESFRTLRAGLLASNHDGNNAKVLLITSPLSGDGTTTIAGNLARALAMGGSLVLLIDCDLKRGRMDILFGMEDPIGLADKLDREISKETVYGTDLPKLFLLPKGRCNGNSSDLLVRPAFSDLLKQYRDSYDYIIMDGPPLAGEADAITLTRLADAVVVVVKEGATRSAAIENALDVVEQNSAVVTGFVLNHSNQPQMRAPRI
jgi:capsular exopolysaccharide synthesis family protein